MISPDLTLGRNSTILWDYWRSLDAIGHVPSRRDFDIAELVRILGSFVIHERVDRDDIRIRLAGTQVVNSYGREITGQNYLSFFEAPQRRITGAALNTILDRPCGMVVWIETVLANGDRNRRESFGLPVRDDSGAISLVYYQVNDIDNPKLLTPEERRIVTLKPVSRRWIDIGAGVPDWDLD